MKTLVLHPFKTARFVHRANTVPTKQDQIFQTAWTATIATQDTQCRLQKTANVQKAIIARLVSKPRVPLEHSSISKVDELWTIACPVRQAGFARLKRLLKIQNILETTILCAKQDFSAFRDQQRQSLMMIRTFRHCSASVRQDSNVRLMALPSQLAALTDSTNRTLLRVNARISAQLDIFAEAF